MLLSGVISMGIGGPAPDCFIFKVYFRRWYIYWRGRGYVWWYAPRQYILRHEGGSIISGDFSDEETCQSEPQPPRSAPAYGLLTVCFMPLYTWLDVYRHRIPTDRFLSFLFTLRLVRNLLPVSMKVATWSIVPLLLLPSSSRAASPLVFASLSSIFRNQESLGLVLSVERGISAMLRLRWPASDLGYDSITSCWRKPASRFLRVDSILKYLWNLFLLSSNRCVSSWL